jgi:hypothetical protein
MPDAFMKKAAKKRATKRRRQIVSEEENSYYCLYILFYTFGSNCVNANLQDQWCKSVLGNDRQMQ